MTDIEQIKARKEDFDDYTNSAMVFSSVEFLKSLGEVDIDLCAVEQKYLDATKGDSEAREVNLETLFKEMSVVITVSEKLLVDFIFYYFPSAVVERVAEELKENAKPK